MPRNHTNFGIGTPVVVTRHQQKPAMMAAIGSSNAISGNKKAGEKPAFLHPEKFTSRSVFRNHRAAPAIVDANADHIGVATHPIGAESRSGGGREQRVVVGDEQMVPFDG